MPDKGMRYLDAVRTATRHFCEGSYELVVSMTRQVQAHEGRKGAEEFIEEVCRRGKEKMGTEVKLRF